MCSNEEFKPVREDSFQDMDTKRVFCKKLECINRFDYVDEGNKALICDAPKSLAWMGNP